MYVLSYAGGANLLRHAEGATWLAIVSVSEKFEASFLSLPWCSVVEQVYSSTFWLLTGWWVPYHTTSDGSEVRGINSIVDGGLS